MPFRLPPFRQRERAAALIIALAFVVLLSGVVAAYLSRATAHRLMSNSSFHQTKADELARSALEILTGCLKQEIANGSTANTVGNCTLYLPNSNAALMPQSNGSNPAILTLLRISTTGTISAPGVDFAASAASSTGTSANGRTVSLSRWNQHYLLPRDPAKYGGANANKVGTDPVPGFTPPGWVFVTGTGPAVLAAPTNAAIGRYAYAIYDEGALLDINVAGYPFNTTAAQAGGKGSLAFADLSVIGLPNAASDDPKQIDRIVGWRSYATAKPSPIAVTGKIPKFSFDAAAATRYYQAVLSNTTGFLKVGGNVAPDGQTDQIFLSRQQLLEFRRASGFSQDALQYLGTFSRAVTAPSQYASLRVSSGGTVRHYHDDGTWGERSVAAGEPLLQSRFSLGRLAWLTATPPNSNMAAAIQACFGLQWNAVPAGWEYVGSTGNTLPTAIATLDEIAREASPREPNFFELLKAGIRASSLGASSQNPDLQLLQIGANIIDQSDADSAPTALYLSSGTGADLIALGTESLSGSAAQSVAPTFLNRPLRSAGELGYAFRDLQGNPLDFSSGNSADAQLLDLFSAMDEPPLVAGQVHPGRASATVLQALLAGTLVDEPSSQTTLSDNDAKTVAAQLVNQIGNSPVGTRADLVPALSGVIATLLPSASKAYREAPLRALSGVAQGRTWNLLIDVVAQSGLFPASAKNLDQFVVQGERRYWLHIAIDRFTGKVVDQQLEPVDE